MIAHNDSIGPYERQENKMQRGEVAANERKRFNPGGLTRELSLSCVPPIQGFLKLAPRGGIDGNTRVADPRARALRAWPPALLYERSRCGRRGHFVSCLKPIPSDTQLANPSFLLL
jgi:hypothetical protein